jgi:GT2 family glycosyltransferase
MLARSKVLQDAAVVGCRLLNSDLSVQTSCIQTFPTILNQALDADLLRQLWPSSSIWGTAPLGSTTETPARVEVISGACMMIRREVFERIGMFSREYFMYAEDLDLCRNAVTAGYGNYFIGDAAIIHHGGKSSAPQRATIIKWRSLLQYFVKHHGYLYALAFRGVMCAVAVVRLGVLALGLVRPAALADDPNSYPARMKWRDILRTLLTNSGKKQIPSHG